MAAVANVFRRKMNFPFYVVLAGRRRRRCNKSSPGALSASADHLTRLVYKPGACVGIYIGIHPRFRRLVRELLRGEINAFSIVTRLFLQLQWDNIRFVCFDFVFAKASLKKGG